MIDSKWTIFSPTLRITYYTNVVKVGTTVTNDAVYPPQVGTASLDMNNKTYTNPVDKTYNTIIAGSSRHDESSTTSVID